MTCPDCKSAAERTWHGYTWSCAQCRARQVSRGPYYLNSMRTGRLSREYRDALEKARVTHEQVKAAAADDAA